MVASWETLQPQIDAAYHRRDFAATLELLSPALADRPPRLTSDRLLLGYYLQIAGYCAQIRESFDLALAYHRECVEVARALSESGHPQFLADALHFLGDTHIQRGEPDLAAQCLKESLEAAKPDAAWNALNGIVPPLDLHIVFDVGDLAYRRNDYAEAHTYLTWCLDLAKEAGNHNYEMMSLQYLLYLENRAGNRDAAHLYYEAALTVAEHAPEGKLYLKGRESLGIMATQIGENEHAYYHFSRAIRDVRQSDDAETLARLLAYLSFDLMKLHRLADAEKHAREALELWAKQGKDQPDDKALLGRTLFTVGKYHFEENRFSEAEAFYADSATAYMEAKSYDDLIKVLFHIANLRLTRFRWLQAARLFGALDALSRQPEYARFFGEWQQDRLKKMRKYLRPALLLAWRHGAKMTLSDAVACVQPTRKSNSSMA